MAFTYDLSSSDATTQQIAQVRLEIGDDAEQDGARPGKKNFSDAEIEQLLDREGDVMRAAAAACEILARQWSRVATATVGQLRTEYNHVSEMFRQQAEDLRMRYGGGSSGVAVESVREDGYSAVNRIE